MQVEEPKFTSCWLHLCYSS